MALRIGINGFGRIGRLVVRAAVERQAPLEFVAVNDLTDARTLAHLLRYDSVHRSWPKAGPVQDGELQVCGKRIKVLSEKDPSKLPWKQLGVEIVLEATGKFTDREGGALHMTAGARAVLISAPAKNADLTFVIGVNDHLYDRSRHLVVSIGSCTTNCLAPVAKVLHDSFGIEAGLMTTVHSYTSDQRLLDAPHSDLRRARAAALSVIPTTTGAAKAMALVMPELKGKFHGISLRVPTPNVSLVDLAVMTRDPVSADTINEALREAAASDLKGILAVTEEELVSSDFKGNSNSSIVDAPLTMVVGDRHGKVFSWYDNEWGYSCRVVDLAVFMGDRLN